MRKFTFLTAFTKVLDVGMKQNPCRHWIRSVFVLSLVMIAWDLYLNGLEMGMSHNPYDLFLCPFTISLESLMILISFLSNMAIQALSHSWPKDISESLHSTSNMGAFFAFRLRFPDNGVFPVFVTFIVALLVNCTVGPLWVSFMYVRTSWPSVH